MEEAHPFGALRQKLTLDGKDYSFYSLPGLKDDRIGTLPL